MLWRRCCGFLLSDIPAALHKLANSGILAGAVRKQVILLLLLQSLLVVVACCSLLLAILTIFFRELK
jgi:hypothetical protein